MWDTLTPQQQCDTLKAMSTYGGGFVSALADAWGRADSHNSSRLGVAFHDLVQRYGPGSPFYGHITSTQGGVNHG